jgi:porphobilinogen synthase
LLDEDLEVAGFEPNKQWGARCDGSFSGLVTHLANLQDKGLRSVMLFGVVNNKDECGSMADDDATPVVSALRQIRIALPDLMCLADVCLCEYTNHGHCGLLREIDGVKEKIICNSSTIERLADIAVAYARAGAHWVCPSDMMDGRVSAIRTALCNENFSHVGIMAYTSKKASAMYAPFRDAVDSTFTGDRKRYQHPLGSVLHARQALKRDEAEGASVLLIKPALFYGDIIKEYVQKSVLPVACYVVSGEYVMLKGYGSRIGDMESVLRESHIGLLRAGASIIVTYFAPELLDLIPKWR